MEVIQELLLPCLWGMIACVGFGLVFNIQGGGILICGLGGALGWFVYLIAQRLLGGDILPAFLAAVCIAIYSELMARVAGETDQFISTMLHTFGMAASLAVGAMLASTVLRTLLPRLSREKKKH